MVDIREDEAGVAGDEFDPQDNGYPEEEFDWQAIWNAPEYSTLIAARQSRRAKEYTTKVNSVLKAVTFASIQAGDFPDAAAVLHYGPPFAHATGQLADSNKRAAQMIDMLTSPNSPAVMFAITAITLGAQIARNHEAQIMEIPNARKRAKAVKKTQKQTDKVSPPRFTIRVLGRQFPVRFRTPKIGKLFSGFRTQTQEPVLLTQQVFSDPKLVEALRKQGINIVRTDAPA